MQLRISPSKLEKFRLHVTEAYFGTITKEAVIDYIKGISVPTERMDWGTAFHTIIEEGPEGYFDQELGVCQVPVKSGAIITLDKEDVDAALNYRAAYPTMVHELAINNYFQVNGHEVQMKMILDGINGTDVHECKTTDKPADYSKYENSIQWRCYALATGCRRVQYDVFQKAKDGKVIPFEFRYLPYKAMEGDVMRLLRHFITFCENENLMDYLKPKK